MSRNIPITAVDQYDFLEHRREQEKKHWKGIQTNSHEMKYTELSSILTVEMNTTELCNRTCSFCPRANPEVFPNRNLHMTPKGAEIIGTELHKNGFRGKISLSGYGENLLNPRFQEIVHTLRRTVPHATLECNTNGDKLTYEYANMLFEFSGLDMLYIM